MINKILCLIGFHDWKTITDNKSAGRFMAIQTVECKRCRHQEQTKPWSDCV